MTQLQTYSIVIFSNLKAPIDKYFATTLLGTLEFVGTILCVIFIKLVGKRRLSFFSMTGLGICFMLTAIYTFTIRNLEHCEIGNLIGKCHDDLENEYSWMPLTLLLGSAIFSHCGIRLLPLILIGEVFPGKK